MNPEGLDHLEVAWTPPAGAFERSPAGRMAARHGITDPAELQRRALEDPEWFWAASAEDVGLRWLHPYDTVLDLSEGFERPHFFAGGRLNWADYTVDKWVDVGRGDAEAIWWEGDDGATATLTYRQLKDQVDRAAGALRSLGVRVGDVVALLLPMVPEAVVTVLAGAKIGAIVAPMFSGYGPQPVRERLEESGAKVLVTCDSFPRRGRMVPLKRLADEASKGLGRLQSVVVVRRSGEDVPFATPRDHWWHELVGGAEPVVQAPALDVETPCLLLFSSGSTGRPKGCVHTHAGMPFKFAQEARHGLGVDETSRVLWLTDMGWVMGSYLITAALTNGATAILFEGVPDHPEPDRLWAVAARSQATVLGIAPTVVRALMGHGDEWPQKHDLSSLEVIGSTGEPWNVEPWRWCFRNVGGSTTPIVNMSGGTECGASIVAGTCFTPTKPAAFSGNTLGMAADVFDADGRSVRGEVGELVVTRPWPGMTKGFWDGYDRYVETYFSRYPGVWQQGDFAYVDADGFWFLLGRSDDTIMLAGKRVGPAEIESVLVSDADVIEAAAVGVPDEIKGEALVCFVVLRQSSDAPAVVRRLEEAIVSGHGKTVRPKAIHVVPSLPKTRNGKVMRRVAKAAYLGHSLGDTTALENPEAIEGYTDLAVGQPA